MRRTRSAGAGLLTAALGLAACDTAPELSSDQTQAVTLTAAYDTTLKAPACRSQASSCDSGTLLLGRWTVGPEPNAPNTIHSDCWDGTLGSYHTTESIDRLAVSSLDGGPLTTGSTVRIDATVWASSVTSDRLDLYYAADANNPAWVYLTTLAPAGIGLQTLSTTYVLPTGLLQAIRGQFRFGVFGGICSAGGNNDRDDLAFTVAAIDNPPSTAISAPAPGATVSATIWIAATASDDLGIAKVEFYRDTTVLLGTATSAPYTTSWNPYGTSNGVHALTSKAYDTTGHVTVSAPVSVNVVDPDPSSPQVVVAYPAYLMTLPRFATLAANAIDGDDAIVSVAFFVDGALVGTSAAAPYSAAWDSGTVGNGAHSFSAQACDAAGHCVDSGPLLAFVDNDFVPPVTTLTSPADGAVVSGTITLTATASDNRAVDRLEFYVDAARIGVIIGTPYTMAWNFGTVADGPHTLTSKAYDAAGNTTTSEPVSVTVSNVPAPALTAVYDATVSAPRCSDAASSCDSAALLDGRAASELHTPNLIDHACADGAAGSYHADESLDRLKVWSPDGFALSAGKTVWIDATVWAYSSFSSDALDLYYAASAASPTWVYIATLRPFKAGAQTLSASYVLPAGATQAIRGQFRFGGSAAICTSGSFNDRDDLVFSVQP